MPVTYMRVSQLKWMIAFMQVKFVEEVGPSMVRVFAIIYLPGIGMVSCFLFIFMFQVIPVRREVGRRIVCQVAGV